MRIYIKLLLLCIYSIYIIYSSIRYVCLHVTQFTCLHCIVLLCLDLVYCLCVIFFRIHVYMFTSTHVYCLFIIYMISGYSLGFLIQEHTWITESSCKHVYHPYINIWYNLSFFLARNRPFVCLSLKTAERCVLNLLKVDMCLSYLWYLLLAACSLLFFARAMSSGYIYIL